MFLQVCIDSIIIGDVEQLGITFATAAKVIITAMEHFVPKQELHFLGLEHIDETAVVVKIPAVSSGSATPFVGIGQFETSSQVAKERLLDQQAHAAGNEFFTDLDIQGPICRTQEISELLFFIFCSCCGHIDS